MSSVTLGQVHVNFPVRKVTFSSRLSVTGKGFHVNMSTINIVCQSSHKKENTNKHDMSQEIYLSEGKCAIQIFFEL